MSTGAATGTDASPPRRRERLVAAGGHVDFGGAWPVGAVAGAPGLTTATRVRSGFLLLLVLTVAGLALALAVGAMAVGLTLAAEGLSS